MWEVYWYTRNGEECTEQIDTQQEADTFIQYNEREVNEHPRKREEEEANDNV